MKLAALFEQFVSHDNTGESIMAACPHLGWMQVRICNGGFRGVWGQCELLSHIEYIERGKGSMRRHKLHLPVGTALDIIKKLTRTPPFPWPIRVTFVRSPPKDPIFSCNNKKNSHKYEILRLHSPSNFLRATNYTASHASSHSRHHCQAYTFKYIHDRHRVTF